MARHLQPGGVLLVEPWLPPDGYTTGTVHALYVDQPQLKIARINVAAARDRVSLLDFHYLVGTPEGVEHFTADRFRTERPAARLLTGEAARPTPNCAISRICNDPLVTPPKTPWGGAGWCST